MEATCSEWVLEEARRLAANGASTGSQWSFAEVCEHLALAFEATVKGSDKNGPPRRWQSLSLFERAARCCIKHAMLTTGWFPRGVSAPESVTPTGRLSVDVAIERLESAVHAFEGKCTSPGATWGYHTELGRMNARTWGRFHRVHAAHHFSFFKNAKAR